MKEPLRDRVEARLSLPAGTVSHRPRIILEGRELFTLEGTCTLQGCEETALLLRCGCAVIRLTGRDLCVLTLTDDAITVSGTVTALEFLA